MTKACNGAPPNRLSIRYCSPQNINCFASLPIVSEILAGATHNCPASIRTLNGPLLGPVHFEVRFKAQVHHHRDEPGLLGAAIYREVSWTSTHPAVSRTRRWMSLPAKLSPDRWFSACSTHALPSAVVAQNSPVAWLSRLCSSLLNDRS